MGIIQQILGPLWVTTLGVLGLLGVIFSVVVASIQNYPARFGKKTIWICVGFFSGFLLAMAICLIVVPTTLS